MAGAGIRQRQYSRGRFICVAPMPITPFLTGQAFDPEIVRSMSVAFEKLCERLQLPSRTDPASEQAARKIIELAQRGIRDPDVLCDRALAELDPPA